MRRLSPCVSVLLCLLVPTLASAQIIETVGERALGMGGAFVAVADDSSATWWNPAALATGPFLDLSLGWARTDVRHGGAPVARGRVTAVSLSTPPLGVSYYRFSYHGHTASRAYRNDCGGPRRWTGRSRPVAAAARHGRDPSDLRLHGGSRRDHAQVPARARRTHDRRGPVDAAGAAGSRRRRHRGGGRSGSSTRTSACWR